MPARAGGPHPSVSPSRDSLQSEHLLLGDMRDSEGEGDAVPRTPMTYVVGRKRAGGTKHDRASLGAHFCFGMRRTV
jgi:hypothetical protein